MGRRSPIETTVAVVGAFLRQRTWKQADLARHVDVGPRILRKHLEEMSLRGFPLEREEEPPQVYWSMRKGWFPGGVLLESEHVDALIRLLCRLPKSKHRKQLLDHIASALPDHGARTSQLQAVLQDSSEEDSFLATVTQAAAERRTLHFHYYSAARGSLDWRHASVHRVTVGPPARMLARCHQSATLKWFRIDGILNGRIDPAVTFQASAEEEVEEFSKASLDGFNTGDPPREYQFFVAEPDARWVKKNLLASMVAEPLPGGIRVTCKTSAHIRLARFVLGLAPLARAETPELVQLVMELASATLSNHERSKVLRHDDAAVRSAVAARRRKTGLRRA